ncbi:homoserine acetyltransferase family protein-like protein [Cadophora sp. DSE1049]|nr:homoserine acetyltransferase family protein-like protein [Cadophora sp. DSE1049]
MADVQTFKLGDWKLQSGQSIPDAEIAFKTFGDPKSPAIIYPSWYSGSIADNEWLIGEDHVLNPKNYFIIVTALFGNGQSTSPSNSNIRPFPKVTFFDNVRAQHTLVTKHLGVQHARAVLGWSMGAGQTYQWATSYPDFMDIIVPFCGAAKTSLHNQVFLEGVKSALLSAKKHRSAGSCEDGVLPQGEEYRTWTAEEKEVGLKAFGRVYAGWGFSQAFYREKLYESVLGFKDLEDFMKNFWETWALSKEPENLLVMLYTWQSGDCSKQEPYNGDFKAAMQAIRAKALVLPGKTDLYFPPEDSEIEVANMKDGVGIMVPFPSIWGHWAGGPGDSKEDVKWLDEKLLQIGLGDSKHEIDWLAEKFRSAKI